MQFG